jgi:hypothetical protein
MPESTTDRLVEQPSDEKTIVKQEWDSPVLMLLGDARTLTEAGGSVSPDSPATSALS